ncbi:hypothetical protein YASMINEVIRUS_452 [Yasminevirus sp. GU-2018]|uniref:Uncharacterized protein n=1 Tax=Yasminevirus sp. GU-2018 TaxID=2420051 RepID=A0A5K0U7K4_9VIRU|nr:hypothetical protein YASMINEVIRUS_452 [Yasminevirus sp. GU-2018]
MRAVILNLTDDRIDCDKTNIREQIEDIFDDPNNYKECEFTDEQTMFAMIHKALGSPTVGVTACNLWEDKNIIYTGYYIDLTELINHSEVMDDDQEKMEKKIIEARKKIKMNSFASQISSQNVASNMVVIKQQLSYIVKENNVQTSMKGCSIGKLSELIDVLEKIFVKTGVVVSVDGSMQTYSYIMNPIEHLMLTDRDYEKNYVYHEYEVYTHVMMIVADTRQLGGKLNEVATHLAGKPVNGDVFVALYKKPEYDEHPPYASISIDTVKEIASIRRKAPSLTTGLNRSEKEYVNFEKILELERKKNSDKPDLVASEIKGELLNIK